MNDVRAAERMTDAEFQDIQRRLCERNPLGLPFGHPVIRDVLNLVAEVLCQRAELQERPTPPDAAGPDLDKLAEWLREQAVDAHEGARVSSKMGESADDVNDWLERERRFTAAADALARRGRDAGEVERLRAERDEARLRLLSAAGDDLCRLTQEEITELSSGAVQIPPKAEFLASCERFHEQIAAGPGVLTNCLTLAQLIAENEKLRERVRLLEAACSAGVQFIENGVEFGYIRMPDADTPDAAHKTLPMLKAALAPTPPTGSHR